MLSQYIVWRQSPNYTGTRVHYQQCAYTLPGGKVPVMYALKTNTITYLG